MSAEMNEGKIECLETPLGHDLDEPASANELGPHDLRKLADSHPVEQRGRKPGVVVHRQERLKRQGFLVLAVLVNETPAGVRLPVQKRQKPVVEQVLRLFRLLAPPQIRWARQLLMTISQDSLCDQRRVPEDA
jgi:hypothetical protein